MNLKNKLVSSVGILALTLSMTAGVAAADQPGKSAQDNAVLNVTCPYTATVTADVVGEFSVNATDGAVTHNSNAIPFVVVMDLRCNWSTNFEVSAQIKNFEWKGEGKRPNNTAGAFGGTHLDLVGGKGVYVGPTITNGTIYNSSLRAGAPDVDSKVFEGNETYDSDAIENDELGRFDVASPGITTATWSGSLNNLPANLAAGKYVAPLMITLDVD